MNIHRDVPLSCFSFSQYHLALTSFFGIEKDLLHLGLWHEFSLLDIHQLLTMHVNPGDDYC